MTFAVNHLAHAQLIGDLLDSFTAARIVLLGSNRYRVNWARRILHVPAADWRDSIDLARPAPPESSPTLQTAGVAYSNSRAFVVKDKQTEIAPFAHDRERERRLWKATELLGGPR